MGSKQSPTMTRVLKAISIVALVATFAPCLLFLGGWMGHVAVKHWTLAGTVAWFVTTPWWMSRNLPVDAKEVEI